MNKTEKGYKTIDKEHLQTYPEKEKFVIMKCAFCTKIPDLWARRNLMTEYFKTLKMYFFLHFCNFLFCPDCSFHFIVINGGR